MSKPTRLTYLRVFRHFAKYRLLAQNLNDSIAKVNYTDTDQYNILLFEHKQKPVQTDRYNS